MSEKKQKQKARDQILLDHPWCCYCGAPADTTDHCPPRAMFRERRWPQGYEFPCCASCNADGREDERIASVMLHPGFLDDGHDRRWHVNMKSVLSGREDLVEEIQTFSGSRARRMFREQYGKPKGDQLRYAGLHPLELGLVAVKAVNTTFLKLGRALYFKHVGRRCDGRVWLFRVNPLSAEVEWDKVLRRMPFLNTSERANINLSDQFSYRYDVAVKDSILCACVEAGPQFGAIVVAMGEPLASSSASLMDGFFPISLVCPP